MADYHELPSPRALATHVACFWVRTTGDDGPDLRPRIMPDGCIDIVWPGDGEPSIAGPATRAVFPALPARCITIGVRFRPGMAPSLLDVPAGEFLNLRVPLRAAWGTEVSDLVARAGDLSGAEARIAALAAALTDRLNGADDADHLITAGVRWLAGHPAGRVHELCDYAGLGERQLRRRFEAAVGYGPKTLQRILRFRRWLRCARQPAAGRLGLAALAVAAGYADQAHLTREVHRLAGVPPAVLLAGAATTAELADLFKTAPASGRH